MNGKFISGTEILNLIGQGDLGFLKNIYVLYKYNINGGKIDINSLANYNLGAFINDFNSPNVLFVKIEEEQ